jgi:hypothetical protein
VIVLDSSVLVGIIKPEAGSEGLIDLLAVEDSAIGAPTLLEIRLWCLTNLAARTSRWLEEFIAGSRSFRSVATWRMSPHKPLLLSAGRADTRRS